MVNFKLEAKMVQDKKRSSFSPLLPEITNYKPVNSSKNIREQYVYCYLPVVRKEKNCEAYIISHKVQTICSHAVYLLDSMKHKI
jgi:hypothetical protein